MRGFTCPECGLLVFFHNSQCVRCGTSIGVDVDGATMVAVDDGPFVRCAMADVAACNWAVRRDTGGPCRSCALTRTRPNDTDAEGMEAFAETEQAKRLLVWQLVDLDLPLDGLSFDLLSSADGPVTTGHADGVITIDLAESDDAHRVALREQLDEPYRTMLGHLRHEVGHFYWMVLVDQAGEHEAFRRTFGDERVDYAEALERHYADGPSGDWTRSFVSAYAAAHPWEDWAETFAHVLHMRATLQTAAAYGMTVAGPVGVDDAGRPWRALGSDPDSVDEDTSLPEMLAEWLPLTYALNAVNRSMGADDLYPFVLSPAVIAKLDVVDRMITGD